MVAALPGARPAPGKGGAQSRQAGSLPLCRQVLVLRRCPMWLAQALPLDHNVQFHRLTGCVVVGLCPVHTVAHVVNFGE